MVPLVVKLLIASVIKNGDWTMRMAKWAIGREAGGHSELQRPTERAFEYKPSRHGGQGLGVVQNPYNWVKISLVSLHGRTERWL